MEHKLAACRYYINRMLSLPLTKERQANELKTIQTIAHNNNFPNKLIDNLKYQIQRNTIRQKPNNKENENRKKWATFTYHIPKIRKITNLFKHTDIKIAFKNNTTILQLIRPKNDNSTKIYIKIGIYKLWACKCAMH
jgi:hypothetical protein